MPWRSLLAIDEQNRTTWLFADAAGTVRSFGTFVDAAEDHWEIAHRDFDAFGEVKAFPRNLRTLLFDGANSADIQSVKDGASIIILGGGADVYGGPGNDGENYIAVPRVFQGAIYRPEILSIVVDDV